MANPSSSSSSASAAAAARRSSLLTPPQRSALGSVADALIPPLPVPPNEDSSRPEARQYWEHRLSADEAFLEAAEDLLRRLPGGDRDALRRALGLLSTRLGTLLVTGRPAAVPFVRMGRDERVSRLQGMMGVAANEGAAPPPPPSSPPQLWRLRLARSLKDVVAFAAFSYAVAGRNPYWPAMEYPGAPQLLSMQEGGRHQHPIASGGAADDTSRTVAAMADMKWIHPAMLALPEGGGEGDAEDETIVTCDVLVVGSGAGGCVAASVLARAGYQVLVVEKGPYASPASVSNLEAPSLARLYERGGTGLRTSDGAISLLAGSALGGGTAVNWACCLPLPDYVRDEWSAALRAPAAAAAAAGGSEAGGGGDAGPSTPSSSSYSPFGAGGEYDKALDYVLVKLGAVDARSGRARDPPHNPANLRLQAGCNVLGYAWDAAGLCLRDPADPHAGYLGFGDRYGNKRGGVSVFLRDAARHGAKILTDCRVRRIDVVSCEDAEKELEAGAAAKAQGSPDGSGEGGDSTAAAAAETKPAPPPAAPASLSPLPIACAPGSRPRAVGAACVVGEDEGSGKGRGGGRRISIRARKAVVVASGALHTPCLLQRSGLGNPHIGRHLRLHPATAVVGLYGKDDPPVDPYLGAPITTVCGEFELGPLGDGYGARIECPSAHPGLLAAGLGWRDPQSFKGAMRQVRHSVALVVLQRDTSEGSVRPSRDGRTVVVDYRANGADRASMLRAAGGGLQVLLASGARYVSTSHAADPGLALADDHGPQSLFKMASNEKIQNYLGFVSTLSLGNHQVGLFSAHQMGTCRMSASPITGAVDLNGEAWDCDNLYVMDSSLFPTASGVNPMVTVMALAKMLSSRLAARMRYQDRRSIGTFEAVRAREMLAARHEVRSNQYPSYSQHSRHGRLHSTMRLPPRLRALVRLLLGVAALVVAAALAALVASKLRQAAAPPAPPPPPAAGAGESWMDSLANAVGDIKMPGLIPTSVMWTLLLFPFF